MNKGQFQSVRRHKIPPITDYSVLIIADVIKKWRAPSGAEGSSAYQLPDSDIEDLAASILSEVKSWA